MIVHEFQNYFQHIKNCYWLVFFFSVIEVFNHMQIQDGFHHIGSQLSYYSKFSYLVIKSVGQILIPKLHRVFLCFFNILTSEVKVPSKR